MALPILAIATVLLCGQNTAGPPPRSVIVAVEQSFGREWRQLDAHTVFKAGDEVRFRFRANFSGFLYVLDESSSGEHLWLFPTADTGLENQVLPGREYIVPATTGSFVIPPAQGYDIVYWIVSPVSFSALPEVPRRARAFPQHSYKPLIPRCRESTLKARGVCLDGDAGPAKIQDPTGLPAAWQQSLNARDLTIDEESGSSRISAKSAAGGPFVYEFRIAHR